MKVQLDMSVRLSTRSYFSTRFLWTAFDAVDRASEIEAEHDSGESRFDIAHHSAVLTSIIASASFVEAAVNELFQDAADDHNLGEEYLGPIDPTVHARMAALWGASREGRSLEPIGKWQLLLTLADAEPFGLGAEPYQSVALVVQLRNALVHYRPESIFTDEAHALEGKLAGRFPPNALMAGAGNAWWPSHCLGAGCAVWAASAARSFVDEASERLGLTLNYHRCAEDGWFGATPRSW
jgi:hypothetical protein